MSLQARLLLALAYVLLLAIVALEVPLGLSVRHRVNDEVRSRARAQADVLASTTDDLLAPTDRDQLRRLRAALARSVPGRVDVVDRSGRVLADSSSTATNGASYARRPEISAALRGASVQPTRHSASLDADLLATAVPLRGAGGATVGAVRITQSLAAVHRAMRRTIAGLLAIGLLVLAIGLGAGVVLARSIARPVRRLDAAARRIAQGDLSARTEVEGSTEQRSLARTFNEMASRVDRLLTAQRDFVADASHQLRTPLTGLRLRLESARAEAAEPQARADIDAAVAEVDRLAQIVEELLVLSRAGENDLPGEEVALPDAVARAAERWAPAAGRRDQSVQAEANGGVSVWVARTDLDRIVDVLLENALAYAPAGSRVVIRSSGRSIEVLDEGHGVSPEEQELVFERFHRGRAGRAGPSGTGLGLAIARGLAQTWGAAVTIGDRGDGRRGARAAVRFPDDHEEDAR